MSEGNSGSTQRTRPREVTIAGVQTIVGSAMVLLLLVSLETQLNTSSMQEEFEKLLDDPRMDPLGLTVDRLRTLVHYSFMVMGVMAVTSLVLGVYVLKRHGPSRVVLTVLAGLVALFSLFGGPGGWLLAAYVGVCVLLLWTKSARAWFRGDVADLPGWLGPVGGPGGPGGQGPGGPDSSPPPPPSTS